MFGDWGALLVQFLITAVVVLGLVAVVFWLVRRYSAAGLGRIGRGRVPRLAIIDAMSIDGRRRLVLVRRDNVEHLILIGGPTDVVVEQTIQRARRAKAAGSEIDTQPPLPPEETRAAPTNPTASFTPTRLHSAGSQNGADGGQQGAERPFSFRRSSPPQPANQQLPAAPRRGEETPVAASPARFVDVQRPTRIEAAALQPGNDSEPLFPELPTADLPPEPDEIPPPSASNGSDPGQQHLDLDDQRPAAQPSASPYAKPGPDNGGRSGNLAELENEMARLLGEITQKRPS